MALVTRTLIAVNVLVIVLPLLGVPSIDGALALWPVSTGAFEPWQVVTYAFVHAGYAHLGFNMLGLWMFGAELERLWGSGRFALLYTVSVLVAAGAQMLFSALTGSDEPMVGASGGVFGLLIGFAMEFPRRKIVPLIPPIPMPAWLFVTLYGVIELVLGVTGTLGDVAHFAHLGGLLGGGLVMLSWRARGRAGAGDR